MVRILMRSFVGFCLLLAPVLTATAATAIVNDVRGKVDIRSTTGVWQPAVRGMQVDPGTTISTGFNSTAVIAIGPTTVTVQQLTRMKLEELVERQGRHTTSFTLPIGRVQARVKSADSMPLDFTVRSSISTAAVRGTEFEFDGYRLVVTDGVVQFINRVGQSQNVQYGQESRTDGDTPPTTGDDQFSSDSTTVLPGNPGGMTGGTSSGVNLTGSVVVTW